MIDAVIRIEMQINGRYRDVSIQIPENIARTAMSAIDYVEERRLMQRPLEMLGTQKSDADEIRGMRRHIAETVARAVCDVLAERDTVNGYEPRRQEATAT